MMDIYINLESRDFNANANSTVLEDGREGSVSVGVAILLTLTLTLSHQNILNSIVR
jgi:hypothetical protein